MARKNIFELMSSQWDLFIEAGRLDRLFSDENLLFYDQHDSYTLKKYVDAFCFTNWKNRGRCIDVDDFLDELDYDVLLARAENDDFECFLSLIEILFNFWKMAENKIKEDDPRLQFYSDFYHLQDVMETDLSHYNYKALYDPENEQVIVIEDNPAATAVAEISEPDLSRIILRYNHHTLRGDIDTKKAILASMGQALEPKRKNIHSINSTLEDNIFYLLNNLHIRHNNKSKPDKNYKEYVSKMNQDELESWYDELYQMILLAFLELDQVERNVHCKELREKIEEVPAQPSLMT